MTPQRGIFASPDCTRNPLPNAPLSGSAVTTLDLLFCSVLLVSLLIGAWRGLVYEVLSVLGWVLALLCAQVYATTVAQVVMPKGMNQALTYAGGFVITFIGVAFASGLLAHLAKKLIASTGLRPVDRVLGAGFGLLRGLLILLAIGMVVQLSGAHTSATWQQSSAGPMVSATVIAIKPMLPDALGKAM